MYAQIGTLIAATSAVQLANGFFGTVVALRVAEDVAGGLAGLVLSAYFAGFTLGAMRSTPIILRLGHIRAYAAFAGIVVAATAVMPIWPGALAWAVLRALVGFGCAGIFVTTESWLHAKAPASIRGRVFSTYMVGTFVALAAGQLLIARAPVDSFVAFNIIVALFAAALAMVSATRAEPPRASATAPLGYGALWRAAPVAVTGCALSGLLSAAFFALAPAWMQGEGIERTTIALFMLAAVLGGLAFQIPVGRLSDRFDRRLVLGALSLLFAVTVVLLSVLPHRLGVVLPAAALLGGAMSTLYPVCVAHAHDRMPADRVVAVSANLILISGIGSVIGPLLGSAAMAWLGLDGLLYGMAAVALAIGAVAVLTSLGRAAPARLARPFAILAPDASPLAHDPTEGAAR
ncbi:MFS transporter [Roseicella frigidaeris]|uniref:MFS transporter n=1 Tax=Roseicella frigidaeris TaxID=2230885 RepID=A0A327MGB7_9PROT|nr:MFS transporter [Roseicella frigidaeris]